MKLVIGLGNPGRRYQNTRHNFGFMVVEALAEKWSPAGVVKKKLASVVYEDRRQEIVLAKPQIMMNNSGLAVAKLARFYQVKPEDLWVIHDDLDFPLGKVKIKRGGGTAGHRGLESVISSLKTSDFNRVRLGIGHPGLGSTEEEIRDYVLSPFRGEEKIKVKKIKEESSRLIKSILGRA